VKDKIVYILAFAFAFIIVTAAIIYLNSIYKNIFNFDFTSAQTASVLPQTSKIENPPAQKSDSTAIAQIKPDSLQQQHTQNIDTTSITLKDTNAVKNLGKKIEEKKTAQQNAVPEVIASSGNQLVKKNDSKKDSTYQIWIKNTAKLYTSMDSKKAAKIIQGYSDNIARDILLTMKKKKAAEILAEFKPDLATRIISVQQ
jgi:flagellar motility protein MotE (MotC chaperone)